MCLCEFECMSATLLAHDYYDVWSQNYTLAAQKRLQSRREACALSAIYCKEHSIKFNIFSELLYKIHS